MRSHGAPDKAAPAAAAHEQQALAQREALREFMKTRRLAPTAWAKQAGIPSSLLLGYLTGTAAGLDAGTCEKLARAAGAEPADFFAAKEKAASRPPFQIKFRRD